MTAQRRFAFTDKKSDAKNLTRLLLWLAAALLAVNAAAFTLNAVDAVRYKYSFNYVEPVLAEPVRLIPQYPLIYKDLATEPFIMVVYTPIYLYLTYLVSLTTTSVLAAGRIVNLAALSVCVTAIYFILRRLDAGRLVSGVFATMLLAFPVVWRHGVTMRNDLTALAFEAAGLLAALYWIGRDPKHPDTRWKWVTMILFTLAFFTKQSAVAGMGAVALYFFMRSTSRAALVYLIQQAVFISVPFLLLGWATNGNFFAHQKMLSTQPLYFELFYQYWHQFLPRWAGYLAITLLFTAGLARRKELSLIPCYFLLSLLLTAVLAKSGSDDNYFLGPCWALCATMGILFLAMEKKTVSKYAGYLVWVIFWIQSAYILSISPAWVSGFPNEGRRAIQHSLSEVSVILNRLPDPVIAENMALLIANGRPVVFEPFEFTQATNAGVWDEERILRKLRNREIGAVVLAFNADLLVKNSLFSEKFIKTVRQHYRLMGFKHGNYFYLPKT